MTDLLTLNLSSNDYVGHTFGPHSLEVQDITFRTDRQLGAFAAFIEKHLVGEPWVLAITSDHGVAPIPEFAQTLKLPAGRGSFNRTEAQQKIETTLVHVFGEPSNAGKYVRKMDEGEVYLDPALHELQGQHLLEAENIVRDVLLGDLLVAAAFTRHDLLGQLDATRLALQFQRACHPKRSGNVLFALAPYHVPKGATATHGSPWRYDSHVPLLIRGPGIRPGRYRARVTPAGWLQRWPGCWGWNLQLAAKSKPLKKHYCPRHRPNHYRLDNDLATSNVTISRAWHKFREESSRHGSC